MRIPAVKNQPIIKNTAPIPITEQVRGTDGILTARVRRTPTIYPAYEKTEIVDITMPNTVSPPPDDSIFPVDRNTALIIDMTMAEIMVFDFGSLNTNIIVRATAKGYMKWMTEATPLGMFW